MKNLFVTLILFIAASATFAQSTQVVATRGRFEEWLRIGTNSTQKVTGFKTTISAPGSNEKLPTEQAVVNYLTANYTPLGFYSAGSGINISGGTISNTGDLSNTNELNLALYVNAGSLIVEDAGGTVSTPLSQLRTIYSAGTGIGINIGTGAITNTAPDQTVSITDGTGIDVTGTYPNFTVTNTSPNIVQTLSIAGQDLSLSGGGGTVAIPAGSSLGTGFTAGGGAGSIPAGTTIVVETDPTFTNGNFIIDVGLPSADGWDVEIGDKNSASGVYTAVRWGAGTVSLQAGTASINVDGVNEEFSMNSPGYGLTLGVTGQLAINSSAGQFFINDQRVTKRGLEYTSYYSNIETIPQAIPDVQTVNSLIGKKAFNANYTATGTATTAFTVTLPTTQPDAAYSVSIMPKNVLSATGWYISARTTTTFTVTYLTALTGAVDFDYILVN